MSYDLIIYPNFTQTENLYMSEATQQMLVPSGARRERDEKAVPMRLPVAAHGQPAGYLMSQWVKTGHEWMKAKDGTITGTCMHQGCTVNAGDAVIDRNCVGNKRFKIADGQITTTTHDGSGVYVKLV